MGRLYVQYLVICNIENLSNCDLTVKVSSKFCPLVNKPSLLGRGGGQVVTVLAFCTDDPSSNPAEVYSFYSVNC